jgi:hypothetical protein
MPTRRSPRKTQKHSKTVKKTTRIHTHKKNLQDSVKRRTGAYYNFLARRPHRSFRLTRRRDYKRELRLPGYVAFTNEVRQLLWSRKRLFLGMGVLYGLLSIAFGGLTSQATYNELAQNLEDAGSDVVQGSGFLKLGQAGVLAFSAMSGGSQEMSEVQQVYFGIVFLLTWLTAVWLLRAILAGERPRLRDGLYNSGAPFVSTLCIVLIACLQCIPLGIVGIIYAGLSSAGLLEPGFALVLFSCVAIIVAALSFYMLTSTAIAMVVVTIPGMYPFAAMKAAGDLTIGRRLRIVYRLLWLVLLLIFAWMVVVIPIVLINGWLREYWHWLDMVPVVPVTAAIMGSLSVVWASTYIYILYRKIVADDADPA